MATSRDPRSGRTIPRCGRRRGAPRPGALVVAVLAAAAAIASAQSSLAQGRAPWEFENGASKRQAESQYSRYWHENYPAAEQSLDSKRPDLEEAIARLRLSIAQHPQSDARKQHPVDRTNVEYFPYFLLARAFAMQNRPDLAKLCLDKEREFGAIAASRMADEFQALDSRIQLLASLSTLKDQASRAEGWTEGKSGVVLSSKGRESVGRVKAAAAALDAAARSAQQDSAGLQAKAQAVIDSLHDLCSGELGELGTMFRSARSKVVPADGQGLGDEEWNQAFDGKPPDPSICAMPGGGKTANTTLAALQAVEACSEAMPRTMRTAGNYACTALEGQWKRLEALAGQRAALGGSPPDIGELPQGCSINWSRAGLDELSRALDQIDVGSRTKQIAKQIETLTAEIASVQGRRQAQAEEARTRAEAALRRIPSVPDRCVTDLNVDAANRKLRSLRVSPEQAQKIADFDRQVDAAVDDLLEAMDSGVSSLLSGRDQCEGVNLANLDALPGALSAYKAGKGSSELSALCSTAARANSDIIECLRTNTSLVSEKLQDYRWLLGEAAALRQQGDPRLTAAADLDCLAEIRGSLRPDPPRRNPDAWTERSIEDLGRAKTCFQNYVGTRREGLKELESRVGAVHRVFDPIRSGSGPAAELGDLAGKLESVALSVNDLRGKVSELAKLVDPESASGGAAGLRQRVTALGADGAVPEDWWSRLERLEGKDERYEYTWATVCDKAAASVLDGAGSMIDTWERIAGMLGPFVALQESFRAFRSGDLDGAILSLRAAYANGNLPRTGKAAALGHAALSYFLFTKSLVHSAGESASDAARLLEQDALAQAQLAVQADSGFKLPRGMFPGRSFGAFFESCCGESR